MDCDVEFIGEVRLAGSVGVADDGKREELGCGSVDCGLMG